MLAPHVQDGGPRVGLGARLRRRREGAIPRSRAPLGLVLLGVAVAVLALVPIGYLVLRALDAEGEAVGALLRPRTLETLAATLGLGLVVAVADVMIGVPIAWLTTRTDLPGRRLWAVLTVVPLAIPSYVIAFAFVAALGPRGALQGMLEPFGVERLPSFYGLPGAALVLTLATYPYVVLATRVALLRADPASEEAARTLGDTAAGAFRRVTLPLLVPGIAAGTLLALLYALSDFGAVAILQFDSFARQIYVQYRASLDRNLAAVLALVLAALTFAVAATEARVRARYRSGATNPASRSARRVPLGRWRWLGVALCATVVALGLVIPAATILFWLVRGLSQGEPLRLVGDATLGSFLAGAAAAVVAVLLTIPVVLLSVRHRGRLGAFVDRVAHAAYALPGIVLALSVVFLAANLAPVVYQTFGLLVLAYAVRFMAQAIGPVRTGLERMGPRVEEAARTLGDRRLVAFVRVTLPLLRPGLVAGGALVFLTTVKELPMTLLLAPTGFETLATSIWGAIGEGFYARAAAPAALLMLLSAATVAFLLRTESVEREPSVEHPAGAQLP